MYNTGWFKPWHLILVFMLGGPFAAKSQQININSACQVNCGPNAPLSNGQSTSGTFNFDYTVAGDNDKYDISGSYGGSYSSVNGSTIMVDPVVTYIGTTPSAGSDTITFDYLLDYFDDSAGSWAGTYYESGQLNVTAPGSLSAQLLYDSLSVGLATQTGIGTTTFSNSKSLAFGALDTSDTLSADYNFVFNFSAGTTEGANDSAPSISATPEPAMAVPCGLCLLLATWQVRRRNRLHRRNS
jgi:hypothetical protein